jgi:hypothetical protein
VVYEAERVVLDLDIYAAAVITIISSVSSSVGSVSALAIHSALM